MDCEKLFQRIGELETEYRKFWADVVALESPTEDKALVDACGAYYAAKAREKGWKVTVAPIAGSGDIVTITLNPDAPGKPIVFSGHIDTVHPAGLFGTPTVRMDAEKIYGPGVEDCKGGTVGAFLAMAALDDCGYRERPVKLILQSDEENSSRTSGKATVRAMYEEAKNCEVFLNLEPYFPPYCAGTRKGISKYRFTVTGKAIHASRCDAGVSAIAEAAHKILELEKLKDPDGITCSCGLISGGTAVNAVPEKCTFSVDLRFATKEQMEQGDAIVQKVAETSYLPGSTCEWELLSRRCAMEDTEKNQAVRARVNSLLASIGIPPFVPHLDKGGSDAADMTNYGLPTIESIGIVGGGAHSIREWASLASLPELAKRLAAITLYL